MFYLKRLHITLGVYVGLKLLGVNFLYFVRNIFIIRTLLLKHLSKNALQIVTIESHLESVYYTHVPLKHSVDHGHATRTYQHGLCVLSLVKQT